MRRYNPYRNVFYYYRGPSAKQKNQLDKQIEDNTTKALINTLEFGGKNLLKSFLRDLNLNVGEFDRVHYDLQISGELSRPDALIKVDGYSIFIESKIESELEENQIKRHLEKIEKGYLLVITPRPEDKNIIKKFDSNLIRFITWKELYLFFKKQERSGKEVKRFLIGEFIEYLEAINMAPFSGWKKNDFEAFLNIENDPKGELRLMVKKKLKQYLTELKELTKEEESFEDLVDDVGNVKKSSGINVWGVLCKPPIKNKVSKPHFNFWVNSNEFGMGIQIEGKTPANKMKKFIEGKRNEFLKILRELEGFELIIRKRVNLTGRPRNYHGVDVLRIKLGRKDISREDIEYLIKKMNQHSLFEIHCAKAIRRDDGILNNQKFLEESVKYMRQLQRYYRFSLGGAF